MLLYFLPNALSPGSIVIIVIAALILFGGGKKISELMRGTGKGIKEFKKALKDDEEQEEKD
ncbi:MAG: hypothetical protein CM15mP121_0870 [Bacteroidota bacterium]|nr:MAG: hypothetical protein CM15mP121_0870 [Bacteroidota bacterium]|tara:strand:- start:1705 stop:1887 length:183 start_codon:yes stop_codon:yes gene_type:complete